MSEKVNGAEITQLFMLRTNAADELRRAERRFQASANQPVCFRERAEAELAAARSLSAEAEINYQKARWGGEIRSFSDLDILMHSIPDGEE